jgi:hypothetical protein
MRIAGRLCPFSWARASTVSRTWVTMRSRRVRKHASGRPARFCECQPPTLLRCTEGRETDSATRRSVSSRLFPPCSGGHTSKQEWGRGEDEYGRKTSRIEPLLAGRNAHAEHALSRPCAVRLLEEWNYGCARLHETVFRLTPRGKCRPYRHAVQGTWGPPEVQRRADFLTAMLLVLRLRQDRERTQT